MLILDQHIGFESPADNWLGLKHKLSIGSKGSALRNNKQDHLGAYRSKTYGTPYGTHNKDDCCNNKLQLIPAGLLRFDPTGFSCF